MTCPALPHPDEHGWFEPVLPLAPGTWPWALPYMAAVNIAPDPGEEVVAARATPDGEYRETSAMASDRHRLEVIGYWRGEFAIVRRQRFRSLSAGMEEAEALLESIPVHYLLDCGRAVRRHRHLEVTGTWPEHWEFRHLRDLGVCCAYLCERARDQGAGEQAATFKSKVWFDGSSTEQVFVYLDALAWAMEHLGRRLDSQTIHVVEQAMTCAREWLRKSGLVEPPPNADRL